MLLSFKVPCTGIVLALLAVDLALLAVDLALLAVDLALRAFAEALGAGADLGLLTSVTDSGERLLFRANGLCLWLLRRGIWGRSSASKVDATFTVFSSVVDMEPISKSYRMPSSICAVRAERLHRVLAVGLLRPKKLSL